MDANKPIRIFSIINLVLSLVLALGTQYIFHACGAKDDGSFMACHWAQQMVTALGAVLAVQAVIVILCKTLAARTAVSAAMIPTAIVALMAPGGLIHLCMMTDMQCQSVMKPAVRFLAAMIVMCAAGSTWVGYKFGGDVLKESR